MAMTDVDHTPSPGATTKFGKKRKTGVLYLGQHAVLKPVHNCVSGRREVDFYNTVFQDSCDDDHNDDMTKLKHFLPRYLGVEERGGVRHIKLENTLSGFRKPCVIDIKMGHVTSDPFAWPEKVAQRRSKYPYAEKLGFTLSGMTTYKSRIAKIAWKRVLLGPVSYWNIAVYVPERDEFEKVDKYRCHNFTLNQVIVEGLGKFFGFPANPRKDVIRCLLHKLQVIRRWFLRQRQFAFYASSLFIVYEGMVQHGSEHTHCCRALSGCCHGCCAQRVAGSEQYDNLSDCIEDGAQIDKHKSSPCDICSCCPVTDTTQCGQALLDELPDFQLSDSTRSRCADDSNISDCALVDVKLIDFTHAFRTTERDDNYLSGLETLIKILHIMYNSS